LAERSNLSASRAWSTAASSAGCSTRSLRIDATIVPVENASSYSTANASSLNREPDSPL
jgi:hypothetical protein